jgi:chemotaxis receptor (MCP) glutamine deamidase CheD
MYHGGAIEETNVAKKKIMTITKARSKKKRLEFKIIGGKRILQLGGIATAVGDIDQAIRDLRKSRIESAVKNCPRYR